MVKSKRSRSMQRELSRSILGLSLMTAFAFIIALVSYFEEGMEDAAQGAMLIELRAYEARYKQNPDTPLPNSYTTRFFLDNWEQAPELYKKIIPFDLLRDR